MCIVNVVTTIQAPTKAMREWYDMKIPLVVVADYRTPDNRWKDYPHYLSLDKQEQLYPELSKWLGLSTYARKNIGYVYALKELGADWIFETDDDNRPLRDLYIPKPSRVRQVVTKEWANVFDLLYPSMRLWPRGYPPYMRSNIKWVDSLHGSVTADFYQFGINGDPDVDAIQRIARGVGSSWRPCINYSGPPIHVESPAWCPFNTQATLWPKSSAALAFIPKVKNRVCDILRSYIALSFGASVQFMEPLVFQERNEHNLMNDFKEETELYQNCDYWMRAFRGSWSVADAFRRIGREQLGLQPYLDAIA